MRPVVCTKCWWETPNTRSFILEPVNGQPFHFDAGQFVIIQANIDGQTVKRAYSLGPASNSQRLQITVKRVRNGIASNWLLDHFHPGQFLVVSDPLGDFQYERRSASHKLLMLSAGCGIVPVCSVATEALRLNPMQDICFIQCAKNQEQVIYHQLLKEYSEKFQKVSLNLFLKDKSDQGSAHDHRLNETTLPMICPDFHERVTYLCGPVHFITLMKQTLVKLDYDISLLCQENIQETSVH